MGGALGRGAAALRRARDGRRAHRRSIARGSQLLLLLDPPFDRSAQDPGYIKGYPPGVRENGGQYTHAAVWIVMALARLGSGDEAAELFHMLNPINHTRTPADVARYKTEPYVVAGDVYARRAARRARRAGAGTPDRPPGCIGPASRACSACGAAATRSASTRASRRRGPGTRSTWRVQRTRYLITVSNPERRCRGVRAASLDGLAVDAAAIPLVDDGRTHHVRIVLGKAS